MTVVRYYFALTNRCNRACELCSCHSGAGRKTYLSETAFWGFLRQGIPYEAQLEGGEPLLHPAFWAMVEGLSADPLCTRIILCTNGVMIPSIKNTGHFDTEASVSRMRDWLTRFAAKPFLLKPSINAHLVERDPEHLAKMQTLHRAFRTVPWAQSVELTFNLRRRPAPLSDDGDAALVEAVKAHELYHLCNDFAFQRYGRAENETALERPFIIANPVDFHLISPDGRDFGTDLLARARHMEGLP